MNRPRSLRLVRALATVLALAAPGLAPTIAGAAPAAFGQPYVISGAARAGAPQVAVASNGRTAVIYTREVRHGRRFVSEPRVAFGRKPDAIGRSTPLRAGARAARTGGRPQLMARADGSFVACFDDGDGAGKTEVEGCSIAPPTGTFGPLIVVRKLASELHPNMSAVVRPDGSTVLLLTSFRNTNAGPITDMKTAVAILSPSGVVGPLLSLQRAADEDVGSSTPMAVTTDGTVAIPARIMLPGPNFAATPAIRLMPPGSNQFGPVVPVNSDLIYGAEVDVTGGSEFDVHYAAETSTSDNAPHFPRLVRRLADGAFAPALAPPLTPGDTQTVSSHSDSLLLRTGDPLAVTAVEATAPGDSDCLNQIAGSVAIGAFAKPGQTVAPVRLSDPRQIALYPKSAALADGTVVVAWENAADGGASRVEVAIRAPGAGSFSPPQILPMLADLGALRLTANGDDAVLWWTTAAGKSSPQGVVSALEREAPFATPAKLPAHPGTICE